MATNDMLQYLEPAATGGLDTASNRRQVETFLANDTIAIGDVVMCDVSKPGADKVLYVKKGTVVGTGNGLCIGVAVTAAAANQNVNVVISGYVDVSTHGTVAAANMLTACQTSPGTVDGRVAADISPAFGITLEARTGAGLVKALVYKQF
jgi:hypothetical protein